MLQSDTSEKIPGGESTISEMKLFGKMSLCAKSDHINWLKLKRKKFKQKTSQVRDHLTSLLEKVTDADEGFFGNGFFAAGKIY